MSAHNTNSELGYHSTLLFHLLWTFQGLCLQGLLRKKSHFQAKRSPSICTAVGQTSAEKARRNPHTKAKIKTKPSPCSAVTDFVFGVSSQWLESFSIRKCEIQAHGLHGCGCVMCSSAAEIQHWCNQTILQNGLSLTSLGTLWASSLGSHNSSWLGRGKGRKDWARLKQIGYFSAGRKRGQNLVWTKQKFSALSFSKFLIACLLDWTLTKFSHNWWVFPVPQRSIYFHFTIW